MNNPLSWTRAFRRPSCRDEHGEHGAVAVEYVLMASLIGATLVWAHLALLSSAQDDYQTKKNTLNFVEYQNEPLL